MIGRAFCSGQIAAGSNHSLAVKPDGTVWAWGDNSNGAAAIKRGIFEAGHREEGEMEPPSQHAQAVSES
jgi:alpha-tubulin suppressor-like RCC1 family protein